MPVQIETPPRLSGKSEEQLRQLYGYLFRLSENLNIALGSLDAGSAVISPAELANRGAASDKSSIPGSVAESAKELRALIVNTANVIHSEMDMMERTYNSYFEAISDENGSFQKSIEAKITETAENTVASYGYQEQIKALDEKAAGFSAYQTETSGFIKQGFVEYDTYGMPILGIAIGQGLKMTTVEIDGETYAQIDTTQNCAFYTADKVSFRINGQEVAYISNSKLHITRAQILDSAVFGAGTGKWEISVSNGFAIKWI